MSRKVYAVGDRIMLKAGVFRAADSDRGCRIVGILPSDHGEVQYRIRLGSETNERRIVASDIEAPDTAPVGKEVASPASPATREPWFKASSIRITK